jgi:hypothetical protein
VMSVRCGAGCRNQSAAQTATQNQGVACASPEPAASESIAAQARCSRHLLHLQGQRADNMHWVTRLHGSHTTALQLILQQ